MYSGRDLHHQTIALGAVGLDVSSLPPPKSVVETLSSGISEWDFIWK
jgi:hypothetical protein